MKVDRAKALTKEFAGETHYFCSTGCLHAFEARSLTRNDVAHPAEVSHAR